MTKADITMVCVISRTTGLTFAEIKIDHESGQIEVKISDLFEHERQKFLERGISIPREEKENFEGKQVVYLNERIFPRAFVHIFLKSDLGMKLYKVSKSNTIS